MILQENNYVFIFFINSRGQWQSNRQPVGRITRQSSVLYPQPLFFFFGLCRSAAQIFSFYFNLDLKVFCELDMIFKLQASIFFNFDSQIFNESQRMCKVYTFSSGLCFTIR